MCCAITASKEREVRHVRFEGNDDVQRRRAVGARAHDAVVGHRGISRTGPCARHAALLSRHRSRERRARISQTFYANYGFYDTQVDTTVTPVGPKRVDIMFRINEGQPMILDSLAITGLDSVPERDASCAIRW